MNLDPLTLFSILAILFVVVAVLLGIEFSDRPKDSD